MNSHWNGTITWSARSPYPNTKLTTTDFSRVSTGPSLPDRTMASLRRNSSSIWSVKWVQKTESTSRPCTLPTSWEALPSPWKGSTDALLTMNSGVGTWISLSPTLMATVSLKWKRNSLNPNQVPQFHYGETLFSRMSICCPVYGPSAAWTWKPARGDWGWGRESRKLIWMQTDREVWRPGQLCRVPWLCPKWWRLLPLPVQLCPWNCLVCQDATMRMGVHLPLHWLSKEQKETRLGQRCRPMQWRHNFGKSNQNKSYHKLDSDPKYKRQFCPNGLHSFQSLNIWQSRKSEFSSVRFKLENVPGCTEFCELFKQQWLIFTLKKFFPPIFIISFIAFAVVSANQFNLIRNN